MAAGTHALDGHVVWEQPGARYVDAIREDLQEHLRAGDRVVPMDDGVDHRLAQSLLRDQLDVLADEAAIGLKPPQATNPPHRPPYRSGS